MPIEELLRKKKLKPTANKKSPLTTNVNSRTPNKQRKSRGNFTFTLKILEGISVINKVLFFSLLAKVSETVFFALLLPFCTRDC